MTPEAPAEKIVCEQFYVCGKVFKSRARILKHMKAFHKDTLLKQHTAQDSPVRPALFQIREGEDGVMRRPLMLCRGS